MELINYAHRGASSYAPENTFAAFYMGWEMGANGIETDIQRTKDGVLVLYHDNNTLMRIANRPEAIQDVTYDELLTMDMGVFMGEKYKGERIVSLEEFLRHFGGKGLHFALEIKEYGVEKDMIDLIHKYCQLDHVIITSGIIRSLRAVHKIDPEIRLGYLTRVVTPELVQTLKADGIMQICPQASALTPEVNRWLREEGLSVRPWGITDEHVMQQMIDLKVDGMTINFPDVLVAALKKQNNEA